MRWLTRIHEAALGATVVGVAVLLLAEVVLRYFLHQPLAWAEEAANFLFVWMAMLGAALAVRSNAHVQSTLLLGRMPEPLRKIAKMGSLAVAAFFGGILAVFGLKDAFLSMNQRMLVSGLPHGWIVMALPVGGALIAIYGVARLRREARPPGIEGRGGPAPTP